ncbi:hypothetical protein [Candidatus Accumulibacter phosphatis]|uniref:Uncharacterized protein n=1 Tax=Candidatus Accumulibacter phosphatis TaxID=327160 RepID=A0A5S4EIK7_9PROT|nr:hypothetical protein [Candidatus Accumulibacter phosphatis]TMQ75144.1 hypothetical protein ACCUM_1921 [Candidatus Accumulibacter phosphatis]
MNHEANPAAVTDHPACINLDEVESGASVTAQGFLVFALDQARAELERFDAPAQRKVPDLAGSVVIAQALIYLAERLNDGFFDVARSLDKLAVRIAATHATDTAAASTGSHEER